MRWLIERFRSFRSLPVLALCCAAITALTFSTPDAYAAGNKCTDGDYSDNGYRFYSTPTFWENTASFPALPNVGAAMDAGAGGWNSLRNTCGLGGGSWSSYADLGSLNLSPNKADGYNVIGWTNFNSPPADDDAACQAFAMQNAGSFTALACSFYSGTVEYEYGIEFNVALGGFTTNLNGCCNVVQAIATHEYGHISGLGHLPYNGYPRCTSNDYDAFMAMYVCGFGNQQYNLGLGDINGFLAFRP